jgi:hypothetical protein
MTKGKNMLLTIEFWKTAGETAVRVAAAAALGAIGATQVSALEVDWTQLLGIALLAGVVSLLTSIGVPTPEVRAAKREAVRLEAEKAKKPARKPAKKA